MNEFNLAVCGLLCSSQLSTGERVSPVSSVAAHQAVGYRGGRMQQQLENGSGVSGEGLNIPAHPGAAHSGILSTGALLGRKRDT